MGYSKQPKRDFSILAFVLIGIIALLIWLGTKWFFYWPWIIAATIVTFVFYGVDKKQAQANGNRIPEIVLHGMALIGGVFGGWLGRGFFRHKTQHNSFLIVLILATILHGFLIIYLAFLN